MITKQSKQIGFIVYGAGLNVRVWIDQAKAVGRKIKLCDNYAEIWS